MRLPLRYRTCVGGIVLLGLAVFLAGGSQLRLARRDATIEPHLPAVARAPDYGKIPLHFEPNHGQADKAIDFLARGPGYSLQLRAADATFLLKASAADKDPVTDASCLRMSFAGAASDRKPEALGQLKGRVNYFIGDDPALWRTDIPTFEQVRYREIYPGIDVVHYGNQRQLEYDLVVAPGADWRQISLAFAGASGVTIEAESGDLLVRVGERTVRQHKPVIYQEIAGERREIEGSYLLADNGAVKFAVGEYDPTKALVIDPVLVYATYVGGNDADSVGGIAVNGAGNAYIAGTTTSTDFPTTPGAFDASFNSTNGQGDAFITKLDPTGTALIYSTYLGGSSGDSVFKIVIDADGNAYLAGGTTSSNFPTTVGAFDRTYNGGAANVFVAKLNPTGSALVYSTFLGGSTAAVANAMAVNSAGNVFVTGDLTGVQSGGSWFSNYPTTTGAYDTTMSCNRGGFVTKLNTTGTALEYSTYLNSNGSVGIAVDASDNAYVAGIAHMVAPACPGDDFPVTSGAYKTTLQDFEAAFVTKFNSTGTGLIYSTLLGGECGGEGQTGGTDQARAIAVDASGSAYVTGVTIGCQMSGSPNSSFNDFPTTSGAYDASWNSGDAGFVTKFSPDGSGLVYSTFIRRSGIAIALTPSGEVWITGGAFANENYPTTPDAFDKTNESNNPFATMFNAAGSALIYSTFLGGTGHITSAGIALDAAGNAYLAGSSNTLPATAGAYKTTNSGIYDAYVARIGAPILQISSVTTPSVGQVLIQGRSFPTQQSHTVKATEDLSQEFMTIGTTTVIDGNGNFQFTDAPGAGVMKRFYRVVYP